MSEVVSEVCCPCQLRACRPLSSPLRAPSGGLKGYLERARRLLKDAQEGVNPFSGLTPHVPQGANLSGANGPGSAAFAESERLGMKELAKCAFCLVAGGLGERLGFPGIKIGIMSDSITGMTFLEVYISYIQACQQYARKETGKADLQEKVPALLDVDARIAAHDGFIETKPHGHGDVHGILHQHGLSTRWAEEGREWLFIFQDTNPLSFRILCATLGVSAKEGYVMNSVAIPRIPGENIGGICRLVDEKGHSLTLNVEYNQLDPLLKETPTGGDVPDESGFSPFPGNINVLLFNLPAYARCLQQTGGVVPEFVNPKWANSEKTKLKSSTRLESMMQDFPRLCQPGDKVGMTQLDRWIAKTTVKNNLEDARKKVPPECALTAEADIYACNAKLLTLAGDVVIEEPEEVSFLGINAKLGAQIIIKPSFAICLEQLKSKIRGTIRISKKSTLILEGDVSVDGLQLKGALSLRGTGSFAGETGKRRSIENKGVVLVPIPTDELPKYPPSLQIRGYKKETFEQEDVSLTSRSGSVFLRSFWLSSFLGMAALHGVRSPQSDPPEPCVALSMAGGGPFILSDSDQLVEQVLRLFGYLDDEFNADLREVRTQNVELENAKTWKEHTREIKVPHMPYQKLTSHRAAVCLPYDTTIFSLQRALRSARHAREVALFLIANMPIFVPKDLWRWLIGPHTLRQMEFLHHPSHANSTEPPPEPLELSPFFASIHQPLGVEQALEWSSYSDWALLPHVFYFQGIPELFKQLMDMEALLTASAAMKAFNDEELIFAVEHWRKVAQRRRRGGHGLRSRAALRLEGRRADWGHRTSMDGLGRFDVSRASALMVGGSHCW
ncbi:unnamed protein product [Durusdinium trenchii]|uniref:UTP--glucose-1-phosphate uridylyltransferase n=1 Tax=Durusdinium trenchii TaxID=1381693 RepID=A0ABP0NY71_9DINO